MNSLKQRSLYILIDDDLIHNEISRLMIANTIKGSEIVEFHDPKKGLLFLMSDFALYKQSSVTLFLNLNMPSMSGWEFLEKFDALEATIRDRVRIHILTSSIDQADRLRSERIDSVRSFLTKPLSSEIILSLSS